MTFDTKEEAYHAGFADGIEQGKKEAETERKYQEIKKRVSKPSHPPGTVLSKEN